MNQRIYSNRISFFFSLFLLFISLSFLILLTIAMWVVFLIPLLFVLYITYRRYKVILYIDNDMIKIFNSLYFSKIALKNIEEVYYFPGIIFHDKRSVTFRIKTDQGKEIITSFPYIMASEVVDMLNLVKDKALINSKSFNKMGIIKKGDYYELR